MSVSYKGQLGVLAAIPLVGTLLASIDLDALLGDITGIANLVITVTPPSIIAAAATVADLLAQIQALITAGYQPPSVDVKADLGLKLVALQAKYDLLLQLTDLIASGSLRVYEFSGQAGQFGSELGATLGGTSDQGGVAAGQSAFAVVLMAEAGGSGEVALRVLRKGTP
jgi:hypothetical protein